MTPGLELPWSKGKGPEVAPELEGAQESWRCDSCVRQNVEPHKGKCQILEISYLTDITIDRTIPLLPPMPRVEDPVLHWRWGSGLEEEGQRGGPG